MQRDLFEVALNEIDQDGDLVNMVMELTLEKADADEILIDRYLLSENNEA